MEMTKINKEVINTYTYNEALEESLKYFKGDEMIAKVFLNKYAIKDSDGKFYEKTPDDMHHRLAGEISRIENNYVNPISEDKIFELIKDFKYIVPQGGPMSGIGNNLQIVSLSNCFVIGDEGDSYGSILKIDQEQIQLMKRRGGVGHDLSHIRPKGSAVKNSALTSTGIVPFMERYSNSTREVAQDGRRGALMLSISIKHPDTEEFIDAKLAEGKVTGANISVKLDDEFMTAVLNNTSYFQQYPINVQKEKAKIVKEIDAKKLWKKIIHNAWKSAEPGILFWDTIIRESVPDCYADVGFKSVSTNPCGEIALCKYDSCRLLAINLYSYIDNPFTKEAKFNFELFKEHIKYAVKISDDIIDLEIEKIDKILEKINNDKESDEVKLIELNLWKKIKEKALLGRRVGIGITAEGDMLAALGLTYATDDAIKFSEEVHKIMAIEVYKSSCLLAKDRGSFKIYDGDKEIGNSFIQRLIKADSEVSELLIKHGRRNIGLLTAAPTGCLEKDAIIKTDIGDISLEEIFNINGVNIKELETKNNIWFDLIKPINILDINGNYNKITKLYWNGKTEGYRFKLDKDYNIFTSKVHKFLVLINDKEAIWKNAEELKVGDKIIKKIN